MPPESPLLGENPLLRRKVTRECEPLGVPVDSELRQIAVPDFGERTNHAISDASNWFKQIHDIFLRDQYPHMATSQCPIFQAIPGNQIRINSEFQQFAPAPNRKILAVTRTEMFECAGMLPEIGFVEEDVVTLVRAAKQPRANVIEC